MGVQRHASTPPPNIAEIPETKVDMKMKLHSLTYCRACVLKSFAPTSLHKHTHVIPPNFAAMLGGGAALGLHNHIHRFLKIDSLTPGRENGGGRKVAWSSREQSIVHLRLRHAREVQTIHTLFSGNYYSNTENGACIPLLCMCLHVHCSLPE